MQQILAMLPDSLEFLIAWLATHRSGLRAALRLGAVAATSWPLIIGGLAVPAGAQTPSFDCARASAPVEQLICAAPTLAALDTDMAAAFRAAREALDPAGRDAALQDQRRWLRSLLTDCKVPARGSLPADQVQAATACLTARYGERIAALQKPAAAPAASATVAPTPAATPSADGGAKLSASLFAVSPRQDALLTVEQFGRYALVAKSPRGTALQLVDRMAGPGPIAGNAGLSDGRLDVFLDHGSYKVILLGPDAALRAGEEASLSLHGFAETNTGDPVVLPEARVITTELKDFQQRSYWLKLDGPKTVMIEAAGRRLGDLRLWKDGSWLVDTVNTGATSEPKTGEPLEVRRLSASLDAGLYKVVVYGGPGQPWSSGSGAEPLYLRSGLPSLSVDARVRLTASPFGLDRYSVPASAGYARLELAAVKPARLTLGRFNERAPFAPGNSEGVIVKESRLPSTDAQLGTNANDSDRRVVTVEIAPGESYQLEILHQDPGNVLPLPVSASGDYWISTVSSGALIDAIDATAVLIEDRPAPDGRHVIADAALPIGPGTKLHRRFNLLQPTGTFLHVAAPGDYRVTVGGGDVEAEVRIEPFMPPPRVARPGTRASGAAWKLEPGLYTLSLYPKASARGIAELTIDGPPSTGAPVDPPRQIVARLPSVHLDQTQGRYSLIVNARPEIRTAVVLRALPIALTDDLPIQAAPGETLTLDVTLPDAGTVTALGIDGTPLPLALDGAAPAPAPSTGAGPHHLALVNGGDAPLYAVLRFVPPNPPAQAVVEALPALPAGALAALPKFPVLSASAASYLALDKDAASTYAIEVAKPALYRLESTGLLSTNGNLRNRVVTNLFGASANGVGRNFMIQQFLETGSYQLTVKPNGASAGDLGLTLGATPIEDGGRLADGLPARATLQPGHALAYGFEIARDGSYRLETIGLDRSFTMRLEDADGWPVVRPGGTATLEQTFRRGRYRMVLLPQAVEARAVTTLRSMPEPVARQGHGPFPLPWGEASSNLWLEPTGKAPRTPDQWRFTLPADAEITVQLGAEMTGSLLRDGAPEQLAAIADGKPWRGTLKAGAYHLDVVSARPDNRRTYTVELDSTPMLVGQHRAISAPASLELAIGQEQVVEIASFGAADTRARLFRGDAPVAANDDRPNDWNFAITRRLTPGTYRLQVDPAAGASADTTVSVQALDEVAEAKPIAPTGAIVADATTHLFPLAAGDRPGLLVVATRSSNAVDLVIERAPPGDGAPWRTIASASSYNPHLGVLVAPEPGTAAGRYRLRVWSTDHTSAPIALKTAFASPDAADEATLTAGGVALKPLDAVEPTLGAALVKLARPGVFRLAGDDAVEIAASHGEALHDVAGRAIIGQSGWLGLIAPLAGAKPITAQARRVDFADRVEVGLDIPVGGAVIATPGRASGEDIVVWRADSLVGQPRLRVGALGAVADGSAIALQGDFAPEGELHLSASTGEAPATVKLQRVGFARQAGPAFVGGVADVALPKGKAIDLSLPAGGGPRRLGVVLPADSAAIVLRAQATVALLWSGSDATVTRLDADADRLILLTLSDAAPHAGVTATPIAPELAVLALKPGKALKESFAVGGAVELMAGPGRLRVFGGSAIAQVDGEDAIAAGSQLDLAAPARVSLRHGAGLLIARLDDAKASVVAVRPPVLFDDGHLPATVALAGDAMALSIVGTRPQLVELVTTSAVVSTTRAGTRPARLEAFPDGAKLALYAPAGDARFDLEAAGSGTLSGVAELRATALATIDEGLGPKTRLAGGEARGYAFHVPERRRIGVGVRASIDVAQCRLIDADGTTIGVGLTQMHELPAGDYVLMVEVPLDAPPVDVEPALVGVRLPSSAPPDDVKRSYIALVGRKTR